MLECMRTTVRLDPELMAEVRRLALSEQVTLTAILDRALREMLARRRQCAGQERRSMPTFRGRGLQPGVDLDDTSALLDLMGQSCDPA